MLTIRARYSGTCAGCGVGFGKGATVLYMAAYRGRGWTYCLPCGGQVARDLAADDFDLANNRSM
jgi:hypothetical protein